MPNSKRTISIWRQDVEKEDLELYLCRFEDLSSYGEEDLVKSGFDAAVDFEPFGNSCNEFRSNKMEKMVNKTVLRKLVDYGKRSLLFRESNGWRMNNRIWDYKGFSEFVIGQPIPKYSYFPGITSGFDNYARKSENYFILNKSTPEAYGRWLRHIVDNFKPISEQENLIFINAWNEWAEGNHLDPCQKWGMKYLEVTKDVLNG